MMPDRSITTNLGEKDSQREQNQNEQRARVKSQQGQFGKRKKSQIFSFVCKFKKSQDQISEYFR